MLLNLQVLHFVDEDLKVWLQVRAATLIDPIKQTFFSNVFCHSMAQDANLVVMCP